jgi:hypothetical protein
MIWESPVRWSSNLGIFGMMTLIWHWDVNSHIFWIHVLEIRYFGHWWCMIGVFFPTSRYRSKNDLILISCIDLYLEVGKNTPIMHHQCPKYLISNTWIQKIWEFTSQCQINVIIPNIPKFEDQRTGDSHIMDFVPTHYKHKQVIQINACQMYLKALLITDLTTNNGR